MARTVAVIPTYNEAAVIIPLVREVIEQARDIEALVVDDDSPDGTAGLVREEGMACPRVHLLLRTSRRGRGSAGADGFRRAIEMGAERIIEMDGDGSHDPAFIPALLRACGPAALVIGSRYAPGGRGRREGARPKGHQRARAEVPEARARGEGGGSDLGVQVLHEGGAPGYYSGAAPFERAVYPCRDAVSVRATGIEHRRGAHHLPRAYPGPIEARRRNVGRVSVLGAPNQAHRAVLSVPTAACGDPRRARARRVLEDPENSL